MSHFFVILGPRAEDPFRNLCTRSDRGWITVWIPGSEAGDDERREI